MAFYYSKRSGKRSSGRSRVPLLNWIGVRYCLVKIYPNLPLPNNPLFLGAMATKKIKEGMN